MDSGPSTSPETQPALLSRLQAWYQANCNGEWEHQHGIRIESTDNPGWWVRISLAGTPLAGRAFAPMMRGEAASLDPQPPWLNCQVIDGVFHGAGDAAQLAEILGVFLDWAGAG